MRRVEIPTLRLCKVPGCPNEIDYHADHGKCGPCARLATVAARFHAQRQLLLVKPLPDRHAPVRQKPRVRRRRRITDGELAILRALADGLTDRQIAALTFKAPSTVANTIRRLRFKLHAADRRELVDVGRREGLIE